MNLDEAKRVDAAINAHGVWLSRLRAAIETGSSEFPPDSIRLDNLCDFGRWLYDNFPAAARGTRIYEEIRVLHAQFHKQAAEILSMALGGKKREAALAMDPQGGFLRTSGSLILKLNMLKTRY